VVVLLEEGPVGVRWVWKRVGKVVIFVGRRGRRGVGVFFLDRKVG